LPAKETYLCNAYETVRQAGSMAERMEQLGAGAVQLACPIQFSGSERNLRQVVQGPGDSQRVPQRLVYCQALLVGGTGRAPIPSRERRRSDVRERRVDSQWIAHLSLYRERLRRHLSGGGDFPIPKRMHAEGDETLRD